MIAILIAIAASARRTFLGVPAESWSAWAVWVANVIYVVLAVVAVRQLQAERASRREAEANRLEQAKEADRQRLAIERDADARRKQDEKAALARHRAEVRPYMVVDFDMSRRHLVMIKVENVGRTAATDLTVTFNQRLESAEPEMDLRWQDAPPFSDPIPMFAPGRRSAYFLDVADSRFEQGGTAPIQSLPVAYTGRVSYRSFDGHDKFDEPFTIDLRSFALAAMADRGIHDVAKSLDEIRALLKEAQDGSR